MLRRHLLLLLPALLALTGCPTRSLVGEAFYCACSIPPFGRGGCGSGFSLGTFDSWACVPPTSSAEAECNAACQHEATIASGVALQCVEGFPDMNVPILHAEPAFAGRCAVPATGPLLAASGYDSSAWGYVPARSRAAVDNGKTSAVLPLASGTISLFMPNGFRNPGPMTFDMLSLVSPTGAAGTFSFDGHIFSDFRLLNSGPFDALAGPAYLVPPRPGQINSYEINAGKLLSYTVVVDGHEMSDLASNPMALQGWIYAEPSPSLFGGLDYYFVYEGAFTVGDPTRPATLRTHLEFKYGGTRDLPEPPTVGYDRGFPSADETEVIVEPTPKPSTQPAITYKPYWVKGSKPGPNSPILSTSMTPKFNRKLVGNWVTLILQAQEARVIRTIPICLDPKGC